MPVADVKTVLKLIENQAAGNPPGQETNNTLQSLEGTGAKNKAPAWMRSKNDFGHIPRLAVSPTATTRSVI